MTDPEEWEHELERLSRSVRPVGPLSDQVAEAVRRRVRTRRRRTGVVGALATAAVVGAVAVSTSLATSDGGPARDPAPAASEAFTCPTGLDQLRDPPPIPDLAAQQELADELVRSTRALSAFGVTYAEPTHLGVVALVVGSLELARTSLSDAALVFPYDASLEDAGADGPAQVRQVIQWQLDSVVRELRRATRGIAGNGGLALWADAGAVVLQWKQPVPAEVASLAGVRESGVEVQVWPVERSEREIGEAQQRLQPFLDRAGLRDAWSSSVGCADNSGLVVGMVPPIADRAALAQRMGDAVGMPVMVVPEERPVPLVDLGGG